MIEPDNKEISVRRQCELLGLNRSNVYYEPVGVTEERLRLMHRVDEIFTEYPFYGSRRIQEALEREGIMGRQGTSAKVYEGDGIAGDIPEDESE